MPTAVQFRRGTTAQHSSFTGAVGEITVDTDKNTVVVHDGSTAGGSPLLVGGENTSFGNLTVTGNLIVQGSTITIDTATAQTVDLGDNDKIRLGDTNDLQIFHDGTQSVIADEGTGPLKIKSNDLQFNNVADSSQMIQAVDAGAVTLFHNGSPKIATTTLGVDITGEVKSDSLTVDGASHIEEVMEKIQPATSTSGTTSIYVNSGAIVRFSVDQTGNRTLNFVGDATTALNDIMTDLESLTIAVLLPNGATPYYVSTVQVDSSTVTPKWSGGSAPTAGNANSTDVYSFTIIKISDATFEILASIQQYA
jgi:hypothetical protein